MSTAAILSTSSPITRRVHYDSLPDAARDAAKKSLLDTLGVILAASGLEPAHAGGHRDRPGDGRHVTSDAAWPWRARRRPLWLRTATEHWRMPRLR